MRKGSLFHSGGSGAIADFCRYFAVTLPLLCRYFAVTLPLLCRYFAGSFGQMLLFLKC
jgi:hypothetical protein